jgi:hypothetical protein
MLEEAAMLLTSAANLARLTVDDIAVVGFDRMVPAGRMPDHREGR